MKKLTPRQKKSLDLKRRIYDSFCKLAVENDGEFTVKEICEDVNISVGSFYNLFESKEAVTQELYQYQADDMEAFSYPEDPDEKIREVMRKVLELSMSKGVAFMEMAAIYEIQHSSPLVMPEKNQQIFISTTSKKLIEALEEGKETGRYHFDEEASYYSDMLIFLFRSVLFYWQISKGNFDAKKKMEEYTETILKLLKA